MKQEMKKLLLRKRNNKSQKPHKKLLKKISKSLSQPQKPSLTMLKPRKINQMMND